MSLEELLIALSKFGKVRVSYLGDGWYASIDLFVPGEGVDFKIASDFKNPSPRSALNEMRARMEEAFSRIPSRPTLEGA